MVKKTLIFLSLFLFLNGSLVQGQNEFPFLGEITAKNVNVRSGQASSFDKLNTLQAGDKVVVIGKDFGWYKIKLPQGSKCYMSAKFVRQIGQEIGEVTGSRVNVRAGPGTNYTTIGQLKKGAKVRTLSTENGWARIKPLEGLYGWVSADYVSYKSKRVPPPEVVGQPAKSIYPRKKIVKKTTVTTTVQSVNHAFKKAEKVGSKPISITGKLMETEEALAVRGLDYKVIVNPQTVYYLEGPKHIIDRFIDSVVKVNGTFQNDPSRQYPSPVIRMTKIGFVL